MSPDPQAILEAEDLGWALGELLELIWRGKRSGVMAHELEPKLFQACMTVISNQPFEVRQEVAEIIKATEYWVVFRPSGYANSRSR